MSIPSTYSHYHVPNPGEYLDSLKLKTDAKMPQIGHGEVLIKVYAVSLNYRDVVVLKGSYPAKPGVIPCSDGAGEVIALGEGVDKWKKGDRVMGQFTQTLVDGHYNQNSHFKSSLGAQADGMLAEYRVLPDYGLVRIPEHLSYEEASTLPCAGLTAWNALFGDVGSIPCQPGQTVVLQGTGGVSCFGAQFAVAAGARAIITSSSDDKLSKITEHIKNSRNNGGAGEILTHNYKKDPEWHKVVLKETEEGADHILEVGGAGTAEESFKAIRRGGVITNIGFIGTAPDQTPPNIAMLALFKSAIFRAIMVGTRRQFERMNEAISVFKMKPIISQVFDFKDAAKAFQAMEAQTEVGKIVIRVFK